MSYDNQARLAFLVMLIGIWYVGWAGNEKSYA